MAVPRILSRALTRVVRAPVRRTLARWYPREDAVDLLDRATVLAGAERDALDPQPTLGGDLMVSMASLTRGLYVALIERGATHVQAEVRTAAATWSVYRHMGRIPALLSLPAAVFSRSPTARIRAATNLFRRFPFGPPSYVMIDKQAGDDTVAFDVQRCPVAEYFARTGHKSLCGAAWCDLDYQLAPMWGATLARDTTLAEGDERCGFRWSVRSAGEEAA